MKNERPLILVSNDDGYLAKGINVLMRALVELGDVIVVAPHTGRSGKGCAITSEIPVKLWQISEEPGLKVYACTGTPSDCIKLACHTVVERRPSLIIGGINHGDNSAVNAHYSGTMGVVIEGCMKGIPSIAFSLCSHDEDADFSPTLPYIRSIVRNVLDKGLPYGSCLNVNFPDSPQYAGIKVCRQANGQWINEWEGHTHPRGGNWYWLTGSFECCDTSADADRVALDNNYATITPTRIDFTDYKLLDELKEWDIHPEQ
ncbi:MAG: 5'/3'-nucleotidase SurE [Bacteroidaceae bacterium]|nr:5'/3'-nucleotidase SurE [Bacteroidaceae bacterium]